MTAFHHVVQRKPTLPAPVRARGDGPKRLTPAPVRRLPGPIQRKLEVGAVDDPVEHEGDRVADQVMRMPAPDAVTMSVPPQVSRKCNECQEEEEKLQRKEADLQAAGEAPASVHEALRSPGQPLDLESRAFFEARFGKDFSQVRVHADARAAESAHAVHARAYTVGQHVVFGRDQYAPHTADGRRLLAHELTHTVQQKGGAALRRARDPSGPPLPEKFVADVKYWKQILDLIDAAAAQP